MKKLLLSLAMASALIPAAHAADFQIDPAHSSVEFKVSHLGVSWLNGRFNTFEGTMSYDKDKIGQASITMKVDTQSLDSNHAERNKHLRSPDFIDAAKYSEAKFVSTSVKDMGNGKVEITGDLTFHGTTKPITVEAVRVGEGKDPWGGYRVGFSGSTHFTMSDYGMADRLGPTSTEVYLDLDIEAVKK